MSDFDFNKAINGEPIYCNGERVYPYYESTGKRFVIFNGSLFLAEWRKDGVNIFADNKHKYDLTTDPPKKKVKKTIDIFQSKYSKNIFDAQLSGKLPWEYERYNKIFTIEIEVEE